MGLFDRIFSAQTTQINYSPSNQQEAAIAIMYSCMAVDGNVSDVETDRLLQFAVFKEQFNNHPIVDYFKKAAFSQRTLGSRSIIETSAPWIDSKFAPTLFCMIMDLALSDGILDEKEKEIAEFLSSALKLDEELASKIVEVMLIKNEGNIFIMD
jgi:uncharacterized tellurite resistance protein B-like protein